MERVVVRVEGSEHGRDAVRWAWREARLHGHELTALLSAANGADLLVVASRGVGGFHGPLVGSVSHQLARHAAGPLVVVPPEDRHAG